MTAVTCPRCSDPCRAVRVDELTTHYLCPTDGCEPPGMYMGEHPAKFWALLVVEVLVKIGLAVYAVAKRIAGWLFRLGGVPGE